MALIDQVLSEVADSLRRAIEEERPIDVAQIRFIGLDRIRQAAGTRWAAMKDRVRFVSLTLLRQHLNADDLVIPCGDGFLIVFADAAAAEALAGRCAKIRAALNAFYLGEPDLSGLRAHVSARSLAPGAFGAFLAQETPPPEIEVRDAPLRAPAPEPMLLPLASPKARALAGMCVAPGVRNGAARTVGYRAEWALSPGFDLLALDVALLDAAADYAAASLERGRSGAVVVCVHRETLARRASRKTYLMRLGAIAPALRRQMIARVAEIDRGCPLLTLGEWVGYLKAHVPRVALELSPAEQALATVAMSGAWAAGFRAAKLPPGGGAPERLKHTLAAWSAALRRQDLRFFADDLAGAEALEAAAAAGVDFTVSPALWPESSVQPEGSFAPSASPSRTP